MFFSNEETQNYFTASKQIQRKKTKELKINLIWQPAISGNQNFRTQQLLKQLEYENNI